MKIHLTYNRSPNKKGQSVVFLHPIGTNGIIWRNPVAQLHDYDCLIPDLPGHGQNNHLPWVSIQESARLIAEVIQAQANGGKAHLIGFSLGAYVALELTMYYPELVHKTLISGLNILPVPNQFIRNIFGSVSSLFFKHPLFAERSANQMQISPADYSAYLNARKQVSLRAFRSASQECAAYTLPDEAGSIKQPVLALAGGNEADSVLDSLREMMSEIPNLKGYLVPFSGHAWVTEKPDLFCDTFLAWAKNYPLPDSLLPVSDPIMLD